MSKQTFELTPEFQNEVVSRLDAEMLKYKIGDGELDHDDLSNIFMDVMKDVIEDFNGGEL